MRTINNFGQITNRSRKSITFLLHINARSRCVQKLIGKKYQLIVVQRKYLKLIFGFEKYRHNFHVSRNIIDNNK